MTTPFASIMGDRSGWSESRRPSCRWADPASRNGPLADEAKQALEDMVRGKTVTLAFGGQKVDRYNRFLAHLFLPDGTWVQQRLLETGLDRVYSFPDNRALVAEMLAYETRARAAGRGIWTLPIM